MKIKNLLGFILALLVVCGMMLIGCNNPEDSDTDTSTGSDTDTDVTEQDLEGYKLTLEGDKQQKIKVLDHNGDPIANAVVRFARQDGSSTMDMTDREGAVTKTLKAGNTYITVENSVSKKNYYLVLNESSDEALVFKAYDELESQRVHDGGTPESESIDDDRVAYITRNGGTFYGSGLKGNKTVFFLFVPTKDGIYEFSANIEGTIGYYGAPINAIQQPIEPYAEKGVITIEVKNKNLGDDFGSTTPYLIGVTAENAEVDECLFTIKRAGDPVYTIEDLPYNSITNENNPEAFFVGYKNWNIKLNDIDFSSKVTVALGADGYYHLGSEDGEIIYVRINKESKYIASLYDICYTDILCAYIYDENGEFVDKELYNSLINQYSALCDESTGVYPLDSYLMRAIKNGGEQKGWWKAGSMNYLFGTETIDVDSAWLFTCCTISVDEGAGTESNPIKVEKSTSDNIENQKILIDGGETLYFKQTSNIDSTLKITDKNGDLKVIYNGEELVANTNGTIQVSIKKSTSLEFRIVRVTEGEEIEITFTIT